MKQSLHEMAAQLLHEAKAREPVSYITRAEADAYLCDVVTGIGIRVPKSSIEMRQRSDGVWVRVHMNRRHNATSDE